jgi:hypothetical protein
VHKGEKDGQEMKQRYKRGTEISNKRAETNKKKRKVRCEKKRVEPHNQRD